MVPISRFVDLRLQAFFTGRGRGWFGGRVRVRIRVRLNNRVRVRVHVRLNNRVHRVRVRVRIPGITNCAKFLSNFW